MIDMKGLFPFNDYCSVLGNVDQAYKRQFGALFRGFFAAPAGLLFSSLEVLAQRFFQALVARIAFDLSRRF
ncbi:MAG: hypothetical protein IIB77_01385 [Proteobacteria bacterium]|nr:hypothetical protein [Pseudomonadota bacterium]